MFVQKFPLTVTGKIQKFKMREDTVKQFGLDKDDFHEKFDG